MSPERWQQIEELFHAALTCEPGKRNEFLAAKCAGDEWLRREVDSLISSLHGSASFIETPAADVAAELLQSNRSFEPGQQIEHYKIASRLGSGGMGDVYLAEDLKLKRRVALKLLPPHFTVNPDRVRRFEREARAASKLNHPNIVTIYEIGRSNSTHFIATELVDGKTLRQLINDKPLTLRETLYVSIQVADALTGAHAAGIVHRDIKPENIMIHRDGYVKILDFGLAKLSERHTTDADLETVTLLQSNPGLVMGTVQYMSPEQSRGRNVGVRTDIWSLGIVLYELLSGHVPFSGETSSHVMVSLMENELPPLNHRAVPDELQRIVARALRKDQRERYQTARQFGRELKALKQKLQLDSQLRSWLKQVPSRQKATSACPAEADSGAPGAAKATAMPQSARPTTSAEYVVGQIKRHKFFALGLVVIVLGGALGLTSVFRNRTQDSNANATPTVDAPLLNPLSRGTNNEEAYRYYLQGKNLTNLRTGNADKKAIENFEQAIRLDPNYARAYAGLANAYHALAIHGGSPRVDYEKAKQAVKKALELDSNLGEAYAVRGIVSFAHDWDFAASEKDLTIAIKLEPNNDTAHWGHALLCAFRGRFEPALKEIETAQTIAPGTGMYERDRGRILYYWRRYDQAIVQLTRTLELRPDYASAWSWLWRSYAMKGDYAGAFETLIKSRTNPEEAESLRKAYETAGWPGVQRKLLEFSKANEQERRSFYFYDIAVLFAQLGEKEQAFAYLNKTVEERRWEIAMLNVDPQLDPLRSDPRFSELVRRVGLMR